MYNKNKKREHYAFQIRQMLLKNLSQKEKEHTHTLAINKNLLKYMNGNHPKLSIEFL